MSLDFKEIEKYWKDKWVENQTYKVEIDHEKPKFYILDMFPYPSGAGLHVGHPLGYIASDILSRYKRMSGFNVLHPMGFDSFGLPAEQYALQTGIHPAVSTDQNIKRYKEQLFNLGLDYDWDREVRTSDPDYFKWTQWIFSLLFMHWYDNKQGRAVHIDKLTEIFAISGNLNVDAPDQGTAKFDAAEWNSMTSAEKDAVLMNYRLAYRKLAYVNWCEELGTVLANDEVKDGLSERGGFPVIKKPMRQWSLRITAYAERLLSDLNNIEWSESLKLMQQNWIGRSEGLQMFFDIDGHQEKLEIYTTRPDTIFGVTFMVLSPEHPFVDLITTPQNQQEVNKYKSYSSSRSEVERTSEKKVTGVFTGAFAINPLNDKKIPVWVSEYVLMDYGTGAIMAVPSDDERDRLFAQKFGLDIIQVIDKSDYPGSVSKDKEGKMINSGFINGMEVPDAIETVVKRVEEMNIGKRQINYKLRDANFSRQRYWGEPFPVIYDEEGVAHLLPAQELPVKLPEIKEFKPTTDGKSPLAGNPLWVQQYTGYERETDTMPGFAGSSWYFLRYMDPSNNTRFASEEALGYWKDVDFYIGGTEHAVGHLMYSRFWHKFLFDLGLVPTVEPFRKLVNQGMIQGIIQYLYLKKEKEDGINVFVCASKVNDTNKDDFTRIPVYIDFVSDHGSQNPYVDKEGIDKFREWIPEYNDARFTCENATYQNGTLNGSGEFRIYTSHEIGKMSKRYYNVVNPDDVVAEYGADTFRMYEMFLGPIEQSKPWDTKGIDGVSKFIKRFWSLYVDREDNWLLTSQPADGEEQKILHKTIKKVTADIGNLSFNTAISAMMIFVNEMKRLECSKEEILLPVIRLVAPFAPFIAEELWSRAGFSGSVHHQSFPVHDDTYLEESTIEYPVCINGKKRGSEVFPKEMTDAELQNKILALDYIDKWLEGKAVLKFIIVPGKMINIVVK
ncbi:MAG: leucine--tRNA ligase [Deltaproteobacteria bacterium]